MNVWAFLFQSGVPEFIFYLTSKPPPTSSISSSTQRTEGNQASAARLWRLALAFNNFLLGIQCAALTELRMAFFTP
jgi:hypothetical protein